MRSVLLLLLLFITLQSNAQPQSDAYYCLPCNSSCDTLTFKAAGKCPHCGMDLIK